MPYFSHSEKDLERLFYFAGFYDRIFIHCPRGFDLKYMAAAVPFEQRISSRRFLEVFKALGSKIVFTGYVLQVGFADVPRKKSGGLILVHRGGGSTSPDIITCAILAKPMFKKKMPMTIVAGPASSAAEMRSWRGLIRRHKINGVALLKQTGNMAGLISSAAVVVGTAGGTVYETLRLNKKSVLIPFTGAPGSEHSDQLARAAMLKDLAGARVLDYGTLTPAILARAVDSALAAPGPSFSPEPGLFAGAKVFAENIFKDAGLS